MRKILVVLIIAFVVISLSVNMVLVIKMRSLQIAQEEGLAQIEPEVKETPEVIEEVKEPEVIETPKTDDERAIELFPERITLATTSGNRWSLEPFKWNDGRRAQLLTYKAYYDQGNKQGQNFNHYYPANTPMFTYRSGLVSDDQGRILGSSIFTMSPVLEPIPGTKKTEKEKTTQEFKAVEYPNLNTVWVK